MDLRVNITDEDGVLLERVVIYQDGSDSEGAKQIVEMIEQRYETKEDNDV